MYGNAHRRVRQVQFQREAAASASIVRPKVGNAGKIRRYTWI